MGVSYHKEHVVPPRTQDGFILESKNERDKFGPHVSRIKLLFFLYKSSRSFPFHGKTCIMRIRRIYGFVANHYPSSRVLNRFFGTRDFPYLKLAGIRDFKAKLGRFSGLKVCPWGGMPKITIWITWSHEIWGPNDGIEEPLLVTISLSFISFLFYFII